MTNWLPQIPAGQGPIYIRLADGISDDIRKGVLSVGNKLPPQRELAYGLGVTVGTVGRAYALIRQRGLVSGEVGRGTFVLGSRPGSELSEKPSAQTPGGPVPANPEIGGTRVVAPRDGVIVMDSTAAPDTGQAELIGPISAQIAAEHPYEIASYTRIVPDHWRDAGMKWLSTDQWQPDRENVIPSLGGHAAIMTIMASVTSPGDRILFEELTYSSFARSANLIGRQPLQVRCDDQGAVPEDIERICTQQHPKLLFLMPEMQNPTLAVMSEDRRREIADIARRHNVWLIEDAIYGKLVEAPLTPLSAFAPDRTFHVGGLSKTVAAGIRAAWIACPPGHAQRTLIKHKMMSGGLAFMLGELAARLVLSGAADRILSDCRAEIAGRHQMAVNTFEEEDFVSRADSPFIWLKLPDPWYSSQFKQAAASEGVLVDDEDEFKPSRAGKTHHRIRIGFTTPKGRQQVKAGLDVIKRLLDSAGSGYDSYN